MAYISRHTGSQIDDAITEVQGKASSWDEKQEKLGGKENQFVGFNALGDAIARDIDEVIGVKSFNGRTGDVNPGNGDYTAEMVGARPADWMPTAEDVGALPDSTVIPTRTSQLINDSGFITNGEGGGTSGPVSASDVSYNNSTSELTAVNAQEAIDELSAEVKELFTSGSEGKALIASAVTAKGVETAADATFQEMADNISLISTTPDNLYTIDVSASDPDGGEVSGGGMASGGMNVTVNAKESDGFNFDGWNENGELVESEPTYSFTVENNRNLVANFSEKPLYEVGIDWWRTTLNSAPSYLDVAYGDGVFIAISIGTDVVCYSTDGINWIGYKSLPSSANWASVVYGKDRFVTTTSGGTNLAAYSFGGKIWYSVSLPSAKYWRSITYGNDKFVAVSTSNSNSCAYSSTGSGSWTASTLPSSANWYSVTYGDGKFVAIAYNSNTAAYSDDGITWKSATLPSSAKWMKVTWGDGKFVAVAHDSNKVAYSVDGITWSPSTLPLTQYWSSVCYGEGKFIAISGFYYNSNVAAYSEDGIKWKSITLPYSDKWGSIAYGNGTFVIVASEGSDAVLYSRAIGPA